MKFGLHLPQSGPIASAEAVRRGAKHAESLGFADVWVSDHLALPKDAPYPPSSYILDPFVTLTWAAAVTETIGLGTSVLVLPMRPPVLVAKSLGTLDLMSGGRLIVGAAAGWLEAEFDALGVPFAERGARTDESLELLRRCWTEDPVNAHAPMTGAKLAQMRLVPQPKREIPIWIGGLSDVALDRAIRSGDGWHGAFQTPEQAAPLAKRLREARPEQSFTLSIRPSWDILRDGADVVARELDEFREVGFQHIVADPVQRDLDAWLRCSDEFARVFEIA